MTAERAVMVTRRTVPIVVCGATFSVTLRWNDADWEGYDVEGIVAQNGQTYDDQGYTMDDVRDAIDEECLRHLDEIVASGFNEDDRGWD